MTIDYIKSNKILDYVRDENHNYSVSWFLMNDRLEFEKEAGPWPLSIDCALELICLILGTRVEAVYNED